METRIGFNRERGFLSLLGMVISLIIACLLFYILLNGYFKKTVPVRKIDTGVNSSSIDTTSYKSIVDSTKSTVEAINNQHQKQVDALMEQK